MLICVVFRALDELEMFYPHLESFLRRHGVGGPGAEGHKLGFLKLNREHDWLRRSGKEYIISITSDYHCLSLIDRGTMEQPAKVTAHAK